MPNVRLIAGFFFVVLTHVTHATAVVSVVGGRVIDIDTGESLPFAKVRIDDSTRVATANQDGQFTLLDVPVGSTLVVTKMGFDSNNVVVHPNTRRLTINLSKYEDSFIEEVVVTGAIPQMMQQSGLSQVSLSPELTKTLPNLGEQDIFRSMQLLPGVAGSNESSSGLAVRGGTVDQNLVLFDDYTVYHVDHVFGFFSAFNNNAIKDVQLYKGGFGAKYGGRLSSVVDITGKDGNTEQFNVGLGVSLLSTNALIETPFADGAGSFVLTGRKSYQSDLYNDILESVTGENQDAQAGAAAPGQFALGRFEIEPESYFYDLNSKLTYRLSNDDKFTLSFYTGADKLDNSRDVSGNANLDRLCELLNGGGPFGGGFCEEEISFAIDTVDLSEWGNTGISAKYSRQWNDRLGTNFVVSTSEYFSYRDRLIDSQVVYDDSTDDPTANQSSSNEDNELDDLTVKIENDFFLNQHNTLGFGLQVAQQNIDFSLMQNGDLILETSNEATTSTIYLEDEIVLDKLIVTPGLRANHYSIDGEIYTEPRLSLEYGISDATQIRAAFGDYYQFALSVARQSIEEGPRTFWTLADGEDVPVSKARHFVLGATHSVGTYNFNVEFFHKEYEDLSEFTQQTRPIRNEDGTGLTLILEQEFHTGSGTASGVEFFAQKGVGNLTGWVGYTFSEVIYDFPTVSDATYNADQDATHEFKTVLMYQWEKWDLASTFIYATGRPFTEVLGVVENSFPTAYEVGPRNEERYDAYHRLDLSATYNFQFLGGEGKVGLSIFNVYDRENHWYTEYDTLEGEILKTDVNYRGFTPSLFANWSLF